ncbi:MAG TPA: OmpA family protein [Accumulibacter sp.]|uniref:OmpA family protein n=2 Tax=Candidatus Accumulibacter TaxID=327159 RepID=A0A080M2S8_9PROT|nr:MULTISPECIES: OmpA family protein [Candidatus Accumulibacter]HNL90946.1 OmpA family protein [Nitrospira sp.]KFB75401.1 MAG: Outer membrane protein II* [Candidatus Accumulibacter cognatus]MBL8402882.1 OmpA family protein [Accumulibacter sp.]MCC2869615.1 OmpA family protein [Candidatus Accumulibacter phosphatis]MCM8623913.1 OmpA family protein [Accumulibacter sp.]
MNRTAKYSMMALLTAATVGFGASLAHAQTSIPLDRVYVIDQRGEVVMSGAGLCWRTGFWTPAAAANDPAGCKCDKDLLPKEVCEPAVAKAAPGAAAPAPGKPAGDKITVAADALFDFDKATLRPEGKAKLDDVVAKSKAIKLEVIIAVGHTDRFGSDAYNQKLSEKRAAAVKAYLVSKGIEANRVYTEGKGKKNPVTKPDQCPGPKSKKTIACLQPDRRVDIELIGTK